MNGLSVLWWTCMKHCEWPWVLSTCVYTDTYLLHTHTHCLFGTKCSLIRCNCQVRGLVIFCTLCTDWSMNAHTTKHFKALSNTHVYLSSSSLPNGYKPLIQTSTVKDCCTADRPHIFSACASKRVIVLLVGPSGLFFTLHI